MAYTQIQNALNFLEDASATLEQKKGSFAQLKRALDSEDLMPLHFQQEAVVAVAWAYYKNLPYIDLSPDSKSDKAQIKDRALHYAKKARELGCIDKRLDEMLRASKASATEGLPVQYVVNPMQEVAASRGKAVPSLQATSTVAAAAPQPQGWRRYFACSFFQVRSAPPRGSITMRRSTMALGKDS